MTFKCTGCRYNVSQLSAVEGVCSVHFGRSLLSAHYANMANKTGTPDWIHMDRSTAARLSDASVSTA